MAGTNAAIAKLSSNQLSVLSVMCCEPVTRVIRIRDCQNGPESGLSGQTGLLALYFNMSWAFKKQKTTTGPFGLAPGLYFSWASLGWFHGLLDRSTKKNVKYKF
jgi:hypothetical protein